MTYYKGKQWKKEIKVDDKFIEDGRDGDLVIPIMGIIGAGKSTFINKLLGGNFAVVGHDLQSETQYIHHYRLRDPTRRIFIVDTPGFDDTSTGDREILRRIAVWMAKSYSSDMKVAGIIYLQEITQTRVTGTTRKNLDMFEKLCGPDAASSIILATSKWSEVKRHVGEQREVQLRDEHWKEMLMDGSKMRRFDGFSGSAQAIVNEILARRAVLDATQIQSELVEIDKLLAETETLRYTLKELLEQQKKMAMQLRQNGDTAKVIETDAKIRAVVGQMNALKIALGPKLKGWAMPAGAGTSNRTPLPGPDKLTERYPNEPLTKEMDRRWQLSPECPAKPEHRQTNNPGYQSSNDFTIRKQPNPDFNRSPPLKHQNRNQQGTKMVQAGSWQPLQQIPISVASHRGSLSKENSQASSIVTPQRSPAPQLVPVEIATGSPSSGRPSAFTPVNAHKDDVSQHTVAPKFIPTENTAQLRKDESSDQAKAIMQETRQKMKATLKQIDDLSGNRALAWLKHQSTSTRR